MCMGSECEKMKVEKGNDSVKNVDLEKRRHTGNRYK